MGSGGRKGKEVNMTNKLSQQVANLFIEEAKKTIANDNLDMKAIHTVIELLNEAERANRINY